MTCRRGIFEIPSFSVLPSPHSSPLTPDYDLAHICIYLLHLLVFVSQTSACLCSIVCTCKLLRSFFCCPALGSDIMCFLDTLSNRQKIGQNVCLAPSEVWMQTQQFWLLLTVTTRTGCLIGLSEDLLLYLHRKVRGRSQSKQDITFLSRILF